MEGQTSFSLLELFTMGGIFMWPLLVFSIATLGISVERLLYLYYHNLRLEDLKEALIPMIRHNNLEEAAAYLEERTRRSMGARVLLTLINRARPVEGKTLSMDMLEKAVEAEAMDSITTLESGFNFLTALGSLSPLTGFLGTVSGMIGAFKSIAEATEVNAQIVANGIYEALITTVFGLIIAIIAMVFHSLFSHRVDRFAAETEKTCSDLLIEIALLRGGISGIGSEQ